ncbi:rubrerythrin family protein [Candidatus Pacearchaeota archaeon]|nr:MAG: rubrerythrin family protein [Candidatus Pacearchaeota archaeon]
MRKMTKKSLEEAFAGESMAHMKYLIFSEIAEEEGFKNVARLFKAIAYAEQVHAKNHAKNLDIIKNTKENLQSAINGETFEIEEMYPAYDAIAKLQGEKGAEKSIYFAIEAEKIHAKLYKEAKEAVEKGKDIEIKEIYICPVCGYTHIGEPPEKCPICGAPKEKFKKF